MNDKGFKSDKKQHCEMGLLHRTIKNKKHADRIKALLLLDDGYTKNEISRILLPDRSSIDIWIFQYKKERW